ncbi:MAG: hypothetical protein WA020_14195 [Candidatus Acidiferrales bacterium]
MISTAALFLLLGLAAPVYAYQDQQKPPKQEQQAKPAKQQQAKPARQEQAKPARTEPTKSARQEQPKQAKEQQAKAKPARTEPTKSARQEQTKQAKAEQGQRAESSQRPERTQQAEARQRSEPALRLSARGDGRIPDDRFHSNFGRGHEFHMGNPVLVGGYSRFQYGGYWFGFVQPWPAEWYYTDDVYIDYVDGGYYMYDPYYPGQRIAISVYL